MIGSSSTTILTSFSITAVVKTEARSHEPITDVSELPTTILTSSPITATDVNDKTESRAHEQITNVSEPPPVDPTSDTGSTTFSVSPNATTTTYASYCSFQFLHGYLAIAGSDFDLQALIDHSGVPSLSDLRLWIKKMSRIMHPDKQTQVLRDFVSKYAGADGLVQLSTIQQRINDFLVPRVRDFILLETHLRGNSSLMELLDCIALTKQNIDQTDVFIGHPRLYQYLFTVLSRNTVPLKNQILQAPDAPNASRLWSIMAFIHEYRADKDYKEVYEILLSIWPSDQLSLDFKSRTDSAV